MVLGRDEERGLQPLLHAQQQALGLHHQRGVDGLYGHRLEGRPQPRLLCLAPVVAAACVTILWQQPDFQERGGGKSPVVVDVFRQGEGYAVRVKNDTERDVFIGAYLKDSAGDLHWLAPFWPAGAAAPELVRVGAHTPLQVLATGVVPEAPAKGKAELVGLAAAQNGHVETDEVRPFLEARSEVELR